MKTSNRYLAGTVLVFLALPVLLVVYSRLVPGTESQRLPERTPAAALAALGSFSAITIEGDFAVEITGAPAYSVTYEALLDERGDFVARVENGTLNLRGFGNRSREAQSRVVVGVPDLEAVNAEYVQDLRISGLDVATLNLRLVAIPLVTLADNTIGELQLSGYGNDRIAFAGNRIAASQMRIVGEMTLTTQQ